MPFRGACDACRRRKVKCDGADFCATCRISGIDCQRTTVPRKRGRRPTKKPTNEIAAPTIATEAVAATTSSHDGESDRQTTGNSPNLPDHGRTHQVRELGTNSYSPSHVTFDLILHHGPSEGHPYSSSPRTYQPLSPFGYDTSPSTTERYCHNAEQIHEGLFSALGAMLPAEAMVQNVHHYIHLFMQYIFPNYPIIFESTLRTSASLLQPPTDAGSPNPLHSYELSTQLASMRGFAMITAMCAVTTSVMPEHLVQNRHLISASFLNASRAMLRLYEDHDLEYPNSSSLIIRLWHSITLQNTTGKTGLAWHYQGEAALVAQRLRLYNEETVCRIPGQESQVLRACFWQLYLTDIAGIATNTRTPVLSEVHFDGGLTLREHGEHDEPMLDPSKDYNQGLLESRLVVGFHFKIRVWSLATRLIQDIRAHGKHRGTNITDPSSSEFEGSELGQLVEAYMAFESLIEELPSWLHRPDCAPDCVDEEISAYQTTCFWVQRWSILSAFHCLKLIILQCCEEFSMPEVMGFSDHAISLAMKKLDIARSFFEELQTVPFLCVKIQGEPAVQRIRRVGTLVLQVGQTVGHDGVRARSKSLLTQLLDLLAKLDSKASDSIGTQNM
ncbi:unnamed protein product [Clonostachys chloroleuca]|uniref:Zn(2)-C6 fungal-type domain-containing protein n=1 Tax=Clonostachys chloroleuca TaxID=1926264 RepID=A0AA35LTF5_9HYPO|nr:unnamed protein product [Clonostachys chloroleuca]